MKEIDLKQIKSMEELKKELGNKYDEVMYKMNLELLDRMDKAVEYIKKNTSDGHIIVDDLNYYDIPELLRILQGGDKE